MALDLYKIKEQKESVLNLKRQIGLDGQAAEVVLALDYSGSMSLLYRNGTVQKTLERLLPLGLAFDDNGAIDFYLFSDGVNALPINVTLKNLDGYIDKHITGQYQMGGTNYAPVIKEIVQKYGKTTGGFLGVGAKPAPRELPVYVIYITDGDNYDRQETERIVQQASEHAIFFQFVGIGSEHFEFLNKLDNLSGRKVDNANFFKVPDLTTIDDNQLYSLLMKEFPGFVTAAKSSYLLR